MNSELEKLLEAQQLIRQGLDALPIVPRDARGLIVAGLYCVELLVEEAKERNYVARAQDAALAAVDRALVESAVAGDGA